MYKKFRHLGTGLTLLERFRGQMFVPSKQNHLFQRRKDILNFLKTFIDDQQKHRNLEAWNNNTEYREKCKKRKWFSYETKNITDEMEMSARERI